MKWLIRLLYLCNLLTIVAVIAPIAYFVLAFGLLLRGSVEHVLASTIVVYGLVAVPFLAAPALVVLGVTLSIQYLRQLGGSCPLIGAMYAA